MILDSNEATITVHDDGCVELDTIFGMVPLSQKSQKLIYQDYMKSDHKKEKELCAKEYEENKSSKRN